MRPGPALDRARELALAHARLRLADAQKAVDIGDAGKTDASPSVHSAAHHGRNHVDFWKAQFPQILADLPARFRALEVGCGLGWHGALTAANAPGAEVLAMELDFGPDGVYSPGNATTFRRLAEWAPELERVVRFTSWDTMELDPRLKFLRASAHHLPMETGSVYFLYTYNCLEHIPDLNAFFGEAARVLKVGGILFASAQPFYYSPFGHHLEGLMPLPWGHILWPWEELADLLMKEVGESAHWSEGEPLERSHILGLLNHGLNYAAPADLRGAMVRGPWRINGWVDIISPETTELANRLGLFKAVDGIEREALLTTGVQFRLTRREGPEGLRLPMRLPVTWRAAVRRLLGMA